MDRCAVLVDAGYLLGGAGTLVCGDTDRSKISVDYTALIIGLIDEAHRQTGLPVLRVLWYDGARESQLTLDHRRIRGLPNVKVRLGDVVKRGDRWIQKGVDSYLQRDLTTLARNRAVADVVLVGGDEDLRRGLDEAQDYGVRAHLWGVAAAAPEYNQSESLIAEADQRWVLPGDWIRRFVRQAEPPEDVVSALQASAADVEQLATDPEAVRSGRAAADTENLPLLWDITSKAQAWQDNEDDATVVQGDPVQIGWAFGKRWSSRASDAARSTLLSKRPNVPPSIDGELLRYADRLGVDTWADKPARIAVRGAFWKAVDEYKPDEE